MVYMYHSFLIHLSADGHLGCFHVLHQAFLSMGLSGQEYWSGLPLPTPGDLPDPVIEPMSPDSPALAGRFFTTELLKKTFL